MLRGEYKEQIRMVFRVPRPSPSRANRRGMRDVRSLAESRWVTGDVSEHAAEAKWIGLLGPKLAEPGLQRSDGCLEFWAGCCGAAEVC